MAKHCQFYSVIIRLVPFILLLSPIFIVASAAEDLPDLGTVLAGQSELSTYYELIKKYPEILLQLPTTGRITILAPSNAAFANIPGTSLSNVWNADSAEIAPGNIVVFISGGGARSILKKVDIPFKGGLVQMIDNLLVPPGAINTTLTSFQDLSFLGALYAADLYDQVANGTGNYTIFASSVPGFQVVNGTLSNLTDGVLQQVMKYHIVPSHVLPSSALLTNPELGLQPAVYSGAVDASTMVVTDLPWTTALPCTHEVSNDQQLGDKQQHGRRGYCGKVYRLGDEWGLGILGAAGPGAIGFAF
ncbi:fasciclin domain-containing protein [Seiridium cupressi]